MCWSAEISVAFTVVGAVATGVAARRGAPAPIWGALGYFTAMEALQVSGYAVVDACGTTANQTVTVLSYLHIVFQPLVINLFALELVAPETKARVRRVVLGLAALSAVVMLVQLVPVAAWGRCAPGSPLCGEAFCTATGTWHIAWHVPYNGLLAPFDQMFGTNAGFPSYMLTVFVLPLFYGAWRFVAAHAVTGPMLAWALTGNANEMPAVWCLFSILILFIALSPLVRRQIGPRAVWGAA